MGQHSCFLNKLLKKINLWQTLLYCCYHLAEARTLSLCQQHILLHLLLINVLTGKKKTFWLCPTPGVSGIIPGLTYSQHSVRVCNTELFKDGRQCFVVTFNTYDFHDKNIRNSVHPVDIALAYTLGLLTGFISTSTVGRTVSIIDIFLGQERAAVHCHLQC